MSFAAVERFGKALRGIVRCADGADLSSSDEIVIGSECLLERNA